MVSKENLARIAEVFKVNSVTPETMKNKDYIWNVYLEFCVLYDENPTPASGELLVRYSTFLIIQRNCSVPTVRASQNVSRC